YLHKSMKREEFLITPSKVALNKMIDYFFNGNEPYFRGEAKTTIKYDPIHFQVEGYHSIITSTHKSSIDDRKAAIEIQIDYPITLNHPNIEAIVLPSHLAESSTIKSFLAGANIP